MSAALFRFMLLCLLLLLPLRGLPEGAVGPSLPSGGNEKLLSIQEAINLASDHLSALRKELKQTHPSQQAELLASIQAQNEELASLNVSLERIATGGLTIESIDPASNDFDWQKELIEITRPVLDSLKKLTEKPRQIEQLRSTIALVESQQPNLQKGLIAIEQEIRLSDDKVLKTSLDAMKQRWQRRMNDLERERDVATSQLKALQDDEINWQQSVSASLEAFLVGRMLTLFLAAGLGGLVWLFFRTLNRWVWRNQGGQRSAPFYRFLMYASHAIITLLVIFTVFMVLYVRGDVLLLGLGVLVLLGSALSLQRALPKFMKEVNLLLNMGSAREGERVTYEGVPYLVQNLNVFSVLSNPRLSGVQRLSLEQLGGLLSRPLLPDELWFPSAVDDVLLLPDNTVIVVEQQTVEHVTVRLRGGALVHYPTVQFYGMSLTSLTQGEYFGVTTVFGLDYSLQEGILERYPALIKAEIPQALAAAGIEADAFRDVAVEFRTANASSLDLQIWVSFHRQLAERYLKLERILQGACVMVCNRHQLTIPFPQLTVHMER